CDQLSVAVRRGAGTEMVAVSGAPFLEKRSPLFRAMRTLCEAVLAWGQKLTYAGTRDDSLPPNVLQALDAFLAPSNGKMLVVLPLRDKRQDDNDKPRSALLAECFNPAFPLQQLQDRLNSLAPDAGSALHNAEEHRRVPLRWLAQVPDALHG